MAKTSFTPVSEAGRYKVIRDIKEQLQSLDSANTNVVKGIGDDCAVLRLSPDNPDFLLQTSETYVEGVDFDLSYAPLQHLGYKLMSAAVSDIYAMNGTPVSVTINLAIPNKISTEMISQLYSGFTKASEVYSSPIVGGDITASQSVLVISVSMIGTTHEDQITYRTGAVINDAVCVTGDLGAAYAGLRVLLREKKIWAESGANDAFEPNLDDYEYVVRRQLVPQSRNDLIETMREQSVVPSSMIDISKNLLQDLMQLVTASKVGVKLYSAAIPVALETRAIAEEFEEDVDQFALQGGEDYELLFTLPEKDVNKLMNHFKDFVVIGKILPKNKGVQMQTAEGDSMHFDTSQME